MIADKELREAMHEITRYVLLPMVEETVRKINKSLALRLRKLKKDAGSLIGNNVPQNVFEALCVLHREVHLYDVPLSGPLVDKLRHALSEEYQKLTRAEKIALSNVAMYECDNNSFDVFADQSLEEGYLYWKFEEYLANYSSKRIERAYGKWLDNDRGPMPGEPPMDIDF